MLSGADLRLVLLRYDLQSMMAITVAVSLDQSTSERDSMTYESLPGERRPQARPLIPFTAASAIA